MSWLIDLLANEMPVYRLYSIENIDRVLEPT